MINQSLGKDSVWSFNKTLLSKQTEPLKENHLFQNQVVKDGFSKTVFL